MNMNKTLNELLPLPNDCSEDELVRAVVEMLRECADRIYWVGDDNWTIMKEPVMTALNKIGEATDACESVLKKLHE